MSWDFAAAAADLSASLQQKQQQQQQQELGENGNWIMIFQSLDAVYHSAIDANFSIFAGFEIESGHMEQRVGEFLLPKEIIVGVEHGAELGLEVLEDGIVW